MKKRLLSLLMVAILCIASALPVMADDEEHVHDNGCDHTNADTLIIDGDAFVIDEVTANALPRPCVHDSTKYMYQTVLERSYYAAVNSTQHAFYVYYLVTCPECFHTAGGYDVVETANHSITTINAGHSGNTHKFREYCNICGYTAREYSILCSGPPCNVPYLFPAEIS